MVALVAAYAMTAGMFFINEHIWPMLPSHPDFIPVQALEPNEYYILALWVPFFVLNIIGEELWWRGFIQTRQEVLFGSRTWLVQGILHTGFHLSFGLGVIFLLLPVVFLIPWAVQRTGNTCTGMVVHAGINGPAFLALTLGLIPS